MRQPTGFYPRLRADAGGSAVVSQAGAVVLVETIRRLGLDRELSAATARWRRPRAVHDPGKVVLDLAVTLALGGDCLADIAVLRAEPGLFGPVASDPTVSRVIDSLAKDADQALAAIDTARAGVRARAWRGRRPACGCCPWPGGSPSGPAAPTPWAPLLIAALDRLHGLAPIT